MKEDISKILQIPNTNDWDIIDTYEQMALVNYKKYTDLKRYGFMKGYIIDMETKKSIPSATGYSHKITSDAIISKEKRLIVRDCRTNKDVVFEDQDFRITYGIEGRWIRVFKHKEQVMVSTTSMLNDSTLDKIRGVHLDLSDGQCDYYILSEPYNMIASKYIPRKTKDGFTLFYLKTLCSNGKIIYKDVPVDYPYKTTEECRPTVVKLERLNLNEANRYLQFGSMSDFDDSKMDMRLKPSEFLFLYQGESMTEIHSTAYDWRKMISFAGKSRDSYHNFICNMGLSYIKTQTVEGLEQYKTKVPIFKPVDVNDLKFHPIMIWEEDNNPKNVETRSKNIENIFYAYLASIPVFMQGKASGYLSLLNSQKSKLISLIRKSFDENDDNLPKRAKEITRIAIEWSIEKFNETNNIQPFNVIVYQNIKILVSKEESRSLFRLFEEMKFLP